MARQHLIFAFAILLAFGQVFPYSTTCSFLYRTGFASNPPYIQTDIELAPTITQPTSSICTNAGYTPSLNVQSKWFLATYDTKLNSYATDPNCLVPYNTVAYSYNNAINWLSSSHYANLENFAHLGGSFWNRKDDYDLFAGQNGMPLADNIQLEKSKYADNVDSSLAFHQGTIYDFKAGAGVQCKGSLRLVSTTSSIPGYAYSSTVSEYLGANPSYNIPSVATPGWAKFKLVFDSFDCRATGRTYTSNSCPATYDSVWAYGKCNGLQSTIESNEVTVNFENPFACPASAVLPTPPVSVQQGGSFNPTFNITNTAAKQISVTSISLSQESQAFFSMTGSFNSPVIAPGASAQVSGATINVGSSWTGTKTLKLDIKYKNTQPDCGLHTLHCTSSGTAIVDVTIVPPTLQICSLSYVGWSGSIAQGGSGTVAATCSNPPQCPELTWTATNAQTTFVPNPTGSSTSPVTTLTVEGSASTGSYLLSAHNGALICTALPFNVVPSTAPATCSLSFTGSVPGNNMAPNQAETIRATCRDVSSNVVDCPALAWSQSAGTNAALSAYSTPIGASPQSTLTISPGAQPHNGYAVSASSGALICAGLPFNVVPPVVVQTCAISFADNIPGNNLAPGQAAFLKATCANPSTCPMLTWSHTASAATTLAPNPTPAQNPQTLLTIAANEPFGNYAASASNGALACTNQPFNVVPLSTLPNYVVWSISLNQTFYYTGESVGSTVTTRNIGASAATDSTTNVTFLGQLVAQLPVSPGLAFGATSTLPVSFTCSAPGAHNETAYADATMKIPESNEYDNNLSIQLNCSPKPVSCSCGIANHNLNLSENDSVIVNATCRDASGNRVPCPALAWSHNATGNMVTLNPAATPRSMAPETNLSVGAGVQSQLYLAVKAVSTEPLVTLVCTPAPFNIITDTSTYRLTGCSFPGMSPFGSRIPAFFSGENATVSANCTRNGNPGCPPLNFTTTLANATMDPDSTTGTSSPQTSTLKLPTNEPAAKIEANVTVSCANKALCNESVNCLFIFSPRPDNMTCGIVNHSSVFTANDSAIMEANCTKIGLPGQTACPELKWETNITGGDFNPNPTNATINPITNFSTKNAPVPQSGFINAKGTGAGFSTLQCSKPVLASVQNVGPDYEVTWVRTPSYMIEPGDTFQVRVNVTNIGNKNVTMDTLTALLAANCSGDIQKKPTNPLKAGQSVVFNDFECTCASQGTFNITAVADYGHEITGELNLENNRKSGVYVCGMRYAPTCSDYV